MSVHFSKINKLITAIIAITAWVAVITQLNLDLQLHKGVLSATETVIRFFSYFTILTNLLVAICCTLIVLNIHSFFTRNNVLSAVAVYIIIVGLIYNAILRKLWTPTGLQLIVDNLLHLVVPILFLLYWILVVNKTTLKWKNIFPWLLYPLVYLIFILLRGAAADYYPYPFIDVVKLGYAKALQNSGFVTIAFITISLLIIGYGKLVGKNPIQS
ncbi:MAG: Pr6Pr family membrane protein [Ferruginibacter sp.]